MKNQLIAPFPWFGGKSRVAHVVWKRFGDTPNYVEPFFGSGAVLLGRPHPPRFETINDKDCFVSNFWRALKADPMKVAEFAQDPVNEADLHARHVWLMQQMDFKTRMMTDPEYYEPKIAGWWVWGQSQWVGQGWCNDKRNVPNQRPYIGGDMGVFARRPYAGMSMGVFAGRSTNQLLTYFNKLAQRLIKVRVVCGDWMRVCSNNVLTHAGYPTAVLLDPPYSKESGRHEKLYSQEDLSVANKVEEWAIANGGDKRLRIALCGYEGPHTNMPKGWECVWWQSNGIQTEKSRKNSTRERIWFSPYCLKPALF